MKTVLLANPAAETLSKLPQSAYRRVARVIEQLSEDAWSESHLLRKTTYGSNIYVTRVGDLRLIYSINRETETNPETETVTVITVILPRRTRGKRRFIRGLGPRAGGAG